ncbi:MAG: LacI family DNA-binding transcriptional regulator [Caldilineaceae bacterium]
MKVDIRKVAEKAQVSISTVSRALNDSGSISKRTKDKVLAAAQELGYRHNSIASSLRSKRSSFIGLLVPDVDNEFFSSLASAIEQAILQRGFSLFLCNTMEDQEIENRYVESLLDSQVMGIILVSAGLKSHPQLVRKNLPVVFVDRVGSDLEIPHRVVIESDNEKGGRLAAEQLLKRGVQRFVFLGDQRNMHGMRNREKGFAEYLRANGTAAANYHRDYIPVSAFAAREKICAIYEKFPFDGLFCGTDTIALGAMRGLADIGLAMPADVQLIGFDGIRVGEFTIPSMSTIRQNIERMGKIASESIIRMVTGDQSGETIILPVDFVARETTK